LGATPDHRGRSLVTGDVWVGEAPVRIPPHTHAAVGGVDREQLNARGVGHAGKTAAFHRFGCSAGFALRDGQRVGGGGCQTLAEGGDRRPQPDHVAVLGVTGQPILVSIAKMMTALAHRALDAAVNAFLRALSRSRRTWRLAASSKPGSIGTGWHTRTKSERRNRPRCSPTKSSTRSSSTVVDNRVLIATPVGAATGFTPRHCRKTTPAPSQTTPTTCS
jgi:hypothetical protein